MEHQDTIQDVLKTQIEMAGDFSVQDFAEAQIERSLIMTILASDNGTGHAKILKTYLREDDFTDESHRDAWRVIESVLDKGQEVNMVNVFTESKVMGANFEATRYIMTGNNMFSDIQAQGIHIHELGQKRRMSEKLLDVMMDLHDPEYKSENAVNDLDGIIQETNQSSSLDFDVWNTVHKQVLHMTENKANGKIPTGVMTGIRLIDHKGGLEPGELMIIAGRNSNGKTSLALCLALAAARQSVPVCIFSLEMTNSMLGLRLQSLLSGVDGESIKRADMTESEWDKFVATPNDLPIYFDKKRSTDINAIMSGITAIVEQRNVKVIVIDYLQMIKSRERERAQQVASISHDLQALSTRLEITIILLSQLRRNQGTDYCPRLEELKESGDIADAADSIYLVYRPERHSADAQYPDMSEKWSQYSTSGTALLMCCKNRNGSLSGEELLGFDSRTTRFYERESYDIDSRPSTDFADDDDCPF